MNRQKLTFAILLLLLHTGALAQAPALERQQVVLTPAAPVGATWESVVITVRRESPAPFILAGHVWRELPGDRFTIELRSSVDGRTWDGWRRLEVDQDSRTGDSSGAIAILDPGVRYLRYRLLIVSGAPPPRIDINLVNPGQTPPAQLERHRQRMEETGPTDQLYQVATIPRPPVITRTEWGCPDGQGTSRPPVSYTTVTHLIVHHTVNNNSSADWAAVVRAIWSFHFYDRGYIDIGYNYLIDPQGVIYEGRSGGDNVQGAHFSGVNGGTMGVALLGTFTGVPPTAKAFESLRRILAWKADQRQLAPYQATLHAPSGLLLRVISGHRDGPGATECPGDALYALLPRLRAEVHNTIEGTTYLTAVSAASYSDTAAAPQSILAAYGANLASGTAAATTLPLPEQLGGVTVRVIDSLNREFAAPLFYVSPSQINLLLPAGLANGPATILAGQAGSGGSVAAGSLLIQPRAPALFTANSDGRGAPAALLFRLRADGSSSYEPVSRYDSTLKQYLPRPIEFGPSTDQLFLVVFGTGMRAASSLNTVEARLDQQVLPDLPALPVSFIGPAPGFAGVEQINIPLPRSLAALAGRGDFSMWIVVDGQSTNQVRINF